MEINQAHSVKPKMRGRNLRAFSVG